jgi:hypothetical protein
METMIHTASGRIQLRLSVGLLLACVANVALVCAFL